MGGSLGGRGAREEHGSPLVAAAVSARSGSGRGRERRGVGREGGVGHRGCKELGGTTHDWGVQRWPQGFGQGIQKDAQRGCEEPCEGRPEGGAKREVRGAKGHGQEIARGTRRSVEGVPGTGELRSPTPGVRCVKSHFNYKATCCPSSVDLYPRIQK